MGGQLQSERESVLGAGGKWPIPANTPPLVTSLLEAIGFELPDSCEEPTSGSSIVGGRGADGLVLDSSDTIWVTDEILPFRG